MRLISVVITLFLAVGFVSAQSLKADKPYPLSSGINLGTSDSLVGTHYWYYYALHGSSKLTVRFKTPTTLYGSQPNTELTITLSDERKTWKTTKVVTNNKNTSEAI